MERVISIVVSKIAQLSVVRSGSKRFEAGMHGRRLTAPADIILTVATRVHVMYIHGACDISLERESE